MNKYLILLVTILLGFTACTDLDLEPLNGETTFSAFDDFEGYQSYMAKIYGALTLHGNQGPHGDPDLTTLGNEGFNSLVRFRFMLNCATTDEAVQAWNNPDENELQEHEWSSDNPHVTANYAVLYYVVSMCNDFLNVSEELPADLTAAAQDEIADFRVEARFIRALAHYWALDFYRNVPTITTIGGGIPPQNAPQETLAFIESELAEIEEQMKAPGTHEYGRADRGAVWMLQAQLFLNAETYTGQARFADCITACEKIINSNAYSLSQSYDALFMADNHERRDEIIFPIPQDAANGQTWGGTTTLVAGTIGGAMQDNLREDGTPFPDEALNTYGVIAGWNGYRTTKGLVDRFPAADGSLDKRAMFFTEGQTLDIQDPTQPSQGYRVPKYKNIEAASGLPPAGSNRHSSVDFPLYRLADTYLMLAEAELRNSGNLSGASLDRLNQLRERAYGDNSGAVNAQDVNLEWLLDERARELYWEGHRRTDLIRFGQYTGSAYIWPWKGGEQDGVSTGAFRDIFPIPARELIVNPNMNQNEGY